LRPARVARAADEAGYPLLVRLAGGL